MRLVVYPLLRGAGEISSVPTVSIPSQLNTLKVSCVCLYTMADRDQ